MALDARQCFWLEHDAAAPEPVAPKRKPHRVLRDGSSPGQHHITMQRRAPSERRDISRSSVAAAPAV